jgi:DNA-binding response OmpR family regulator
VVTEESSAAGAGATVLVVEDEQELADLYADYLSDHDTLTAYTGEEALELLDESVDVVLLDRRLPVMSGNEVVAGIEERDLECRIAMVTAVNPDFDIIDLRIDDYLVKPVTQSEVRETVARLVKLDEYNERVRELTAKQLKRNVLEVEKTKQDLDGSREFEELQADIARLETEVEQIADELDIENLKRYL